ncbi:glucokinase [Iodidimonas sp. SYSU 1G8]|uniref:glucokinase n=1 Tax=Iodidimonas sp. SYSU 1G8 TaxID=3133967 RepID=UPI0031FE7B3C
MILAGDIGGTRTRLGLVEISGGPPVLRWKQTLLNADYPSMELLLAGCDGLRGAPIRAACFGVAGPVEDGVCRLTNLDWILDARTLAGVLGTPRTSLINDLAAIALGVLCLPDNGFAVLQQGTRPWAAGSMAVVAPGTGLGEAGLLFDGGRHHVVPSEAGHADFAAATETEVALRWFLAARHGHVSSEHVISGLGLTNIARFLAETGVHALPPALADVPPVRWPAMIAELGLNGGDPLAVEALDLFAAALARECGNAALRYLATGGVCIAGGVAGALLPLLRRPEFIAALNAKGRMQALLETVPVRVSTDPDVGLLGAARWAGGHLDPTP